MIWKFRQTPYSAPMNEWLGQIGYLPVFAAGLWDRGFQSQGQLMGFLQVNPANLLGPQAFGEEMIKAVARLRSAFENKEKIVVFGDYDVDGTSGTALIQGTFNRLSRHYGFSSQVMLSDRFTEGYGLNEKNLQRLIGLAPQLVVTVDCGVSSGKEIAMLKTLGIDVIITDHHGLKGEYPAAAVAVVHPDLTGTKSIPPISGCCVAWQLMRGLWELHDRNSPDWLMQEALDLVALGAVCDIMPLNVPENRYFVRQGMQQILQGKRKAFQVMRQSCNWRKVSTYTLGFIIGPRINAAGRMNKSGGALPVVDWLLSENETECQSILQQLEEFNTLRKREQEESVQAGLDQLAAVEPSFLFENVSVVQGEFHEGVVGIVASKLAEKFNRPAFVMATTEETPANGVLRGSARSIPGVDLFSLIEKNQHHLERWGGHSMAAGLNIERHRMEAFFRAIEADLRQLPAATWQKVRWLDGRLTESDLVAPFFDNLQQLEPYGEKFPPFVWAVTGRVVRGRVLDRPGQPKVGTLLVGSASFPFAMWEQAHQFEFEQEATFFGSWEYNDYQRSMQFRAMGATKQNEGQGGYFE